MTATHGRARHNGRYLIHLIELLAGARSAMTTDLAVMSAAI